MVVAGTDAAAVVLPHLARQLISLHAQRADVAAQVEALVEAHPLYEVLISMPGIGVRTAAVLAGRDPGQDLQAPEPSRPPTPGSLPSHAAPAHRSVASTSPTAATRGSSAPCSRPPSPPCAPTPSPGPTTSANETKANRLGPGRPRPGPPPHPDPARHDPRWSPLRPTTNHETTHRRLTHHIRTPPYRDSTPLVHARLVCCYMIVEDTCLIGHPLTLNLGRGLRKPFDHLRKSTHCNLKSITVKNGTS